MKLSPVVLGLALIAVAPLAPAAGPAPDARVLASVEAIVDYCAKVDPAGANSYQQRLQLVTQGAGEEELAKVRKTNEYQQAHAEALESLAAIPESEAMKRCSQSLAEGR